MEIGVLFKSLEYFQCFKSFRQTIKAELIKHRHFVLWCFPSYISQGWGSIPRGMRYIIQSHFQSSLQIMPNWYTHMRTVLHASTSVALLCKNLEAIFKQARCCAYPEIVLNKQCLFPNPRRSLKDKREWPRDEVAHFLTLLSVLSIVLEVWGHHCLCSYSISDCNPGY